MSEDNDIVRRFGHTPAAFAELYDRYERAVFRYAASRVGQDHAEDIMSETFLVAFGRRQTFDLTVDDARPWLFGIATTLMRKHSTFRR